jgi:hypothetical protein
MGEVLETAAALEPKDALGEQEARPERQKARKKELADVLRGRTCFVVMPYGQKSIPISEETNASAPRFETFDFDAVYKKLIWPCLDAEGFKPIRSDEENGAGMIHQQMIKRIIDSDLVIVDVSSWNPNVFYELGIRHTAQKSGTVIIRRQAEKLPFNIAGMRVIDYPSFRTAEEWEKGRDQWIEAQDRLRAAIIASLRPGLPDSPVHTLVPGLNVSRPSVPLSYHFGVECPLDKFIERNLSASPQSIPRGVPLRSIEALKNGAASKRIGVIEGDLSRIDCVDAWVNPENTRFEMARAHDRSISAIIRSQAANRGDLSPLRREDELARRLRREAARAGGEVETGAAIALPPYRLRQQNNLAAIVHVAAQTGMRGRGYQTTRNLEDCVENALDAVGHWNSSIPRRLGLRRPIRSILFPLFGSASPDWEPDWVAERLIGTAAHYLALWPTGLLEKVYFLAYTDHDRAVCRSAFIRLGLTEPEASIGAE